MPKNAIAGLDKFKAQQIINQLKSGTTPLDAAHYIDVGRERWYRGMNYFLEAAAEGGSSQVRFIRGRYGDGKTHLMSMAMYYALKQSFVVSYASAESTPLNRFEELYKALAKSLQSERASGGLEYFLKDWKERSKDDIGSLLTSLKMPGMDINFRLAIESFIKDDNVQHEDRILQWLLGNPIKLPELGIKTSLTPTNSRDMMRSLSILVRLMGYSGLVVVLDELDRVQTQKSPVRQKVYQNLRQLLDNVDGQGGMQATIYYIAAPSEMYTQNKGFLEYDALRSRLEPAMKALSQQKTFVDYRGVIINLEDTPMVEEDLVKMATNVRDVHAIALQWDAEENFSEETIRIIVEQILREQYNISTPRLVATTIARVADIAEQGGEYDIIQEIQASYEVCEESRKQRHREKYVD
jgi:hypothetical protein